MLTSQPRVGIAVFVFKEGEFLFLQRQGAHGADTWSVPGGNLEPGESFEHCGYREVFEETGVRIGNIRVSGVTNDVFENENKHYGTVWLCSQWVSGEPSIREPLKCQAQRWTTFATMPQPLFLPWRQLLVSPFYHSIAAACAASVSQHTSR